MSTDKVDSSTPTTTSPQSIYDQCILWIQSRILLNGYNVKQWGSIEDECCIDFISNPNTRRLIALMNEDNTSILIATSNFEQLPLSTAKVSHFFFTGSALVQKGFPLGSSRVKVTVQGETRQVDQPREQARQYNYCTR